MILVGLYTVRERKAYRTEKFPNCIIYIFSNTKFHLKNILQYKKLVKVWKSNPNLKLSTVMVNNKD